MLLNNINADFFSVFPFPISELLLKIIFYPEYEKQWIQNMQRKQNKSDTSQLSYRFIF